MMNKHRTFKLEESRDIAAADTTRVEIQRVDSRNCREKQTWEHLREFIESDEHLYPGINAWLGKKVRPEVAGGQRVCYMVREGENTVAASIVRLGLQPKLCTLRVSEQSTGRHWGTILMAAMLHDIGQACDSVHFTIAQSVWNSASGFFRQFGFRSVGLAGRDYRNGDHELFCVSSTTEYAQAVITVVDRLARSPHFAGYSGMPAIMLSIAPKYIARILDGRKTVELRRRFSPNCEGSTIALYSTSPEFNIAGSARVEKVIRGTPEAIWNVYGGRTGCSADEYQAYVNGASVVSALLLDDVQPFSMPIPRSLLEEFYNTQLRPPVSHYGVSAVSQWLLPYLLRAVGVAHIGRKPEQVTSPGERECRAAPAILGTLHESWETEDTHSLPCGTPLLAP